MDKSKRSDLLAAGRKKLLQFRQKKDHKGGNKDAESSSKSSKSEEKDVHVDETTMILEPDPATSTSTLDSDALVTDSSNPTTGHVNLPTAESAELVDQGAPDDARDPEEVQIELPAGCEVSSLALEINYEEVRRPGSDKWNEDSYGGRIPAVDSRMDQAGESIPTVPLIAERAEGEVTVAEPSLGLQASQYLDGLPSQPGERNEAEGNPLGSSVDSKIWFSGMRNRVEDHEIEKIETQTDVSASENYEAEKAKQASTLTTAELAQEVATHIYHGREVPAYDSPEKTIVPSSISLGEKSEFSSSLQVTYDSSFASEQIQNVPSLKNVASDEGIRIEGNLQVPLLSKTTADLTSFSQNVESPILQENDSAHKEEEVSAMHDEKNTGIILGEVTLPPSENVEGLNVEDQHPISGSRATVSSLDLSYTPTQVFYDDGFVYALEDFGRHLYITNVSRDFLKFQLEEESEFHDEFCKQSSAELSKVLGLLQESQKRNTVADEELTKYRSEIQALIAAKQELEIRLLSREQEFQILNNNFQELHSNLGLSQSELSHLSAELVSCRGCLGTLQNEHVNLITSLALETEARKKVLEEKEFLSSENEKLASALLEQKERLCVAIDKQNQLEHIIRESGSYIEQLAEDNLYLSSSLIIHKDKLKALADEHCQSFMDSREAKCLKTEHETEGIAVGDAIYDVQSTRTLDVSCHVQSTLLQNVLDGQPDSFPLLKILKGHLQETKDILKKLETSVEGMYSRSVSLKRSDGRSGASDVSRLIQAFESKQTEISEEEVHMSKGGQSDDSYSVTKEQTSCLRDTIEQIEMEIAKAEVHMEEKWNNRTLFKDFQIDSLGLKQTSDTLQVKIDELVDKSLKISSRVHDIQNQFDEMQQDAHDQMGKFFSDIELLQNETKEKCLVLKQERDLLIDVISEARKKLNKYTTSQIIGGFDEASHLMALVDATTETFKNLDEELDAANLNYNTLHDSYDEQKSVLNTVLETNSLLIGEMHRVYASLWDVLPDSCQNIATLDVDMGAEAILQILPERIETAIMHLKKLLSERLLFLSKSNDLEPMLLTKNQEIQELKLEYNGLLKKFDDLQSAKNELDSILRKKEEAFVEANRMCLALVSKLDCHRPNQDLRIPSVFCRSDEITQAYGVDNDDFFSSLLQLEALVDFYIQEHEGTAEHVNLSKKCLLEMNIFPEIPDQNWSLPLPTLLRDEFIPKTSELLDELDFLCMAYIKHEIEMQLFKENMSRMKDALDASQLDLHLKVSELEQSEQRLSSVREKLGIAVAKGKGLIVQRDNLKQALMDKSSEHEKCLHELQSKDILLQEVEAKLKSYSEVDRIEALESELSYIRNSATALRDSFLLKDSVLQRIEEILEDLDLPEQFHSRDTVEKIELLSKMVAGNSSFFVTDWDQKSSTGGSHFDAGFMVVDSWRDGPQTISNSDFDELKAKYETLERKFYVLAEHNDMLEQSLVQRNSLVQKWEKMLDKFEMPPQLSMLEPKDKIEWLGNLLAEAQQERDGLQMKIKNLEDSSQMVKVSLEESCKKLSEAYSEAEMIRSEKDLLYEKLDKLKYENLGLIEKVSQHNFDKDHFQREMSDLKDKLAEKVQENLHLHNMENEIWRLVDLVRNTFHGSDLSAILSDGNVINCLEALLQKIVDEYTKLELEKYAPKDTRDSVPKDAEELVSEGTSNSGSGDLRNKDIELNLMRLELDKATSDLDLLKVDRDKFMERCQTLMVEIESISKQPKLLQEEIAAEIEKNKSLLSQLEMMRKEKDALREQLTQEEEKSASTREKLNIAVRKGKGLVQQRDSLKQEIEEKNTAIAQLRSEINQQVEALKFEKKMVVNQLKETEGRLKNSNQTLNRLLQILDNIDAGRSNFNMDPVAKLEEIGKVILDLQSSLVSSENESNKSKRAAELLLAELNEVQERADILQEELENARVALLETSKQKAAADTARADAFHRLEEINLLHTEERKYQIDNMAQLKSVIGELKKMYSEISGLLANAFIRDVDFLSYMEIFMESIDRQDCRIPTHLPTKNSLHEVNALSELRSCESPDENSAENLAFVVQCVHECLRNCNDMKIKIQKHSFSFDEQANRLLKNVEHVERKFSSRKEESESLKREVDILKLTIRDKEKENFEVNQTLSFLYQACNDLITNIENGNSQIADSELVLGGRAMTKSWKSASEFHGQACADVNSPSLTYDVIRSLIENLFLMVNGRKSNETAELKVTISHLQREVQEKDAHTSRIAAELVSQIRDAESAAKKSLTELDSAKMTIYSLEKQLEAIENDKKSLELRVAEQRDLKATLNELNGSIKSLNDTLAAKDQEIEALMEALDEEEAQVEDLENKNKELKNIVEEKTTTLENLEASHEKTRMKLSTTVSKFDELYNLSESLLAEVENLQLQLHNQESEISLLRQEVTRCTNELLASQESDKKYSSEVHELRKWFDMTISRFGLSNVRMNSENTQIHVYTDIMDQSIASIMNELDDLRKQVTQQKRRTLTGPSEVEQMVQKPEPGPAGVMTHMRSGRKFNNDQIAIAIDTEKYGNIIDDEDDDKAHGFKSLTMSHIVPRISRPIAEKIDGIWVSGDRLLMRQPTLRLGVLLYWVALHALLASFI